MREIKFRAWDLDKVKMVFVLNMELDYNRDLQHCVIAGSPMEVGERRHDCEDLIFMQYTGLKDTNGKEIYEGDIMSVNGEKAEVYYDENNVCFCLATGIDYNPCIGRYEIIGNIYENPDLLKS